MKLFLRNEQRTVRLRANDLLPALRRLATLAEARCAPPLSPWREVTVHLVDDAGILPVNRAVIGHEGTTDVITQRYDALPGEPPGLIGELFVNVQQAFRVAPCRKGWSPIREVALYLAHGCDHLTGADDHLPRDYARMRRRELRWLRLLGEELPVPPA